ncbi:MAG: peptidylprolyl isomerase, partial [Cyanobacteria bacterium P01_F01_bin.153]
MNLSGNTLGGAVNRYSMGDRPVSQVIGELVNGVANQVGAIALTVACLAVVLASCLSAPLTANASPFTLAALPSGNPISNGKSLLRYSLPIDNETIRDVQGSLEGMSNDLRAKRWGPIDKKAKKAQRVIEKKSDALLVGVPDSFMPEAKELVAQIGTGLEDLRLAVDERDREAIWTKRNAILDNIGMIEESMVTEFPFEVPEDYAKLPQLKGRATVELETSRGTIQITVDGYNAPVTAGNFVDLVQRGFYDNLPFIRAENSYVLQFGDPEGPDEGFNDPKTGKYRAVPLEIMVEGDTEPLYGYTTEEIGLFKKLPVLPFSAYGALAMARPESNNNGGSSQVFFFLFEPE